MDKRPLLPLILIIFLFLFIAWAVIIDAVSQPQAMKKMLEKDFGKVFGFVANASMLVRALKSMGAFKVKDVKFRCPPLCRGSYQQYTNNIREKSTFLAKLRDKVKKLGIK